MKNRNPKVQKPFHQDVNSGRPPCSRRFFRPAPVANAFPRSIALAALLVLAPFLPLGAAEEPAAGLPVAEVRHDGPVDFESEILPILKSNCLACHNQTKAKADLVLETPQTILKGGDGGPTVVPGKPEESWLFQVAAHQDPDTTMPPKNNKVAASNLTPAELGLLKLWIAEGATGEVRSAGPIEWHPLPQGINPIYAVAVSSDGQYAACGRANQIFIYHLPSRQLVTRLTDASLMQSGLYGKPGAAHRDLVHALEFSPDGSLLASSGYREVKLWRRPKAVETFQIATETPPDIIAASPDAQHLATSSGNDITLWNATGERVAVLTGHEQPVLALAFSPDNSKLLSGSKDKSVRVWAIKEPTPLAQATNATEISAVAWLAQGKQFATGGPDKTVRVWELLQENAHELKALKEITGHDGPITSLAAVPSQSDQLLSASEDGSLRLWNTAEGKLIRQMNHGGPVHALAVRPDAKHFASAGANNVIRLWQLDTGKQLAEMKGDVGAQLRVAREERSLSVASSEIDYQKQVVKSAEETEKKEKERLVKATESAKKAEEEFAAKEKALADAREAKSKLEEEVTTQTDRVAQATAAYDTAATVAEATKAEAEKVASMSTVEKAKVAETTAQAETKAKEAAEAKSALDAITKEAKAKTDELTGKIKEADKTIEKQNSETEKSKRARDTSQTELELATRSVEDSSTAVAEGKQGVEKAEERKKQADAALEAARKIASDSERPIRSLAFSPDNQLLASGGDDKSIHTWDANTGQALEVTPASNGILSTVAFLTDRQLITGGSEGKPTILDFNAGWKLERTIGTGDDSSPFLDRVLALDFSSDGKTLATGGGEPSRSGELLLFNVQDGKLIKAFKQTHSDTILDVAFSPDDRHIASAAADRFVRVTDLALDKTTKSFEGHTHHVLGVSWRANGRTLVSAGADNVVKVWDYVTGERKKNVEGFGKEVTSVTFVGVTDQTLSTSGDSKVRLFREDGKEVRSFGGAADFVYAADVTPDGSIVVAGGQDSTLRVWDGNDAKSIATFPAP